MASNKGKNKRRFNRRPQRRAVSIKRLMSPQVRVIRAARIANYPRPQAQTVNIRMMLYLNKTTGKIFLRPESVVEPVAWYVAGGSVTGNVKSISTSMEKLFVIALSVMLRQDFTTVADKSVQQEIRDKYELFISRVSYTLATPETTGDTPALVYVYFDQNTNLPGVKGTLLVGKETATIVLKQNALPLYRGYKEMSTTNGLSVNFTFDRNLNTIAVDNYNQPIGFIEYVAHFNYAAMFDVKDTVEIVSSFTANEKVDAAARGILGLHF